VVTRVEGADRSRPALLLHGHLDVVPADPGEWSVHPFSGEERDGFIWGPRRDRHEGHGRDAAGDGPAVGAHR
jgi:hypothetical protein